MKYIAVWTLAAMAFCGVTGRAQSESDTGPKIGSHELQVWTSGGYSVPGGASDTAVVNAGVRYGWVLTNLHGRGFVRGRFEYALDAIPVFVITGQRQTAYGASFDPVVLRWNLEERGRTMPYVELSGGVLFTNHAAPPGSGTVNFTPSLGLGISRRAGRFRWSAEIHYLHISNSHLAVYNPGINTLQLRFGFGRFTNPE